jgi:predicted ATPase with chaperone activity
MRSGSEPESFAKIRERVMRARGSQLERFSSAPREKLYCNAQMGPRRHIRAFCELSADCERLLERAMAQQGLTARPHDRILKVARTIAGHGRSKINRARAHRRSHPIQNAEQNILGFKQKRNRVETGDPPRPDP